MGQAIGSERWTRIDTTAETVPGVLNGAPTYRPFRVAGGGDGLKEAIQLINVDEQANSTSQPAPYRSHFKPSGALKVIPSPYDAALLFNNQSFFRFILDATIVRTGGILNSYTIQDTLNTIVTREFNGAKFAGMNLSWSDSQTFLDCAIELQAMFTGRLTTALTSSDPGTFPSNRHWTIAQISCQLGADTTVTTTDRTLRALNLAITNSLKDSEPTYTYPAAGRAETIRYGLQTPEEGDLKLTGSFDIITADSSWYDRLIAGTVGALRIMLFHPASNRYSLSGASVTTNPASDTAAATIAEDFIAAAGLDVGDVVYLEDSTNANPALWLKEVLQIQTSTPAGAGGTNAIALDTNGTTSTESIGRNQVFTVAGTRIYTLGAQLLIRQLKIVNYEITGGAQDKVRQKVDFQAEINGANPLLGYLVR